MVPAVKPVISPVKTPFPIRLVSPPPIIVPYVANRSVRTYKIIQKLIFPSKYP